MKKVWILALVGLVFAVKMIAQDNIYIKQSLENLSSDNGDGTFTNPIIQADYPDPDIIRVVDDYYMNGWHVVGSKGKYGKGVVTYKKPKLPEQPLSFPQQGDNFDDDKLSHVWEFYHIPDKSHCSLVENKGLIICDAFKRLLLGSQYIKTE